MPAKKKVEETPEPEVKTHKRRVVDYGTQKEVARIRKNDRTDIVVSLTLDGDVPGLDIREEVLPDPADKSKFFGKTTRGVRIPLGGTEELNKAIARVNRKVKKLLSDPA
jgi:hypothetical protein